MTDYLFRLPSGSPVSVRGWANLPMELAGALAGVKPALHAWVDGGDADYLRGLCAALGFHYQVFATHDEGERVRLETVLGPDREAVENAAVYWHHPSVNPGEFIGYPRCCVESFRAWSAENRGRVGRADFVDVVPAVYARTRPKAALPFLLNNLFYCYSRHWAAGDDARRRALEARNPGLDLANLNVLTWHPCSYRCAASLRAARKIWRLLPALSPELAAQARLCLSKPVLFWDWSRFAVLRGRCPRPGECRYAGLHPPLSLLEEPHARLLRAGDRVRARAGRPPAVYKGRALLGELPPGALLIDFGETA